MVEDATRVAPEVYKVLFENERVRLLEVRMKPGSRTAMHSHPDYLVFMLGDGTVKFTDPSGETGEVALTKGMTMWRDAETHSTENVGTTEVHGYFFEPK